jgi:hypothetical protein
MWTRVSSLSKTSSRIQSAFVLRLLLSSQLSSPLLSAGNTHTHPTKWRALKREGSHKRATTSKSSCAILITAEKDCSAHQNNHHQHSKSKSKSISKQIKVLVWRNLKISHINLHKQKQSEQAPSLLKPNSTSPTRRHSHNQTASLIFLNTNKPRSQSTEVRCLSAHQAENL